MTALPSPEELVGAQFIGEIILGQGFPTGQTIENIVRQQLHWQEAGDDEALRILTIQSFRSRYETLVSIQGFDSSIGVFSGSQTDQLGTSLLEISISNSGVTIQQDYNSFLGASLKNPIFWEGNGPKVKGTYQGTIETGPCNITMGGIYTCETPWGNLTGVWNLASAPSSPSNVAAATNLRFQYIN